MMSRKCEGITLLPPTDQSYQHNVSTQNNVQSTISSLLPLRTQDTTKRNTLVSKNLPHRTAEASALADNHVNCAT
jgi:hypothetical protein